MLISIYFNHKAPNEETIINRMQDLCTIHAMPYRSFPCMSDEAINSTAKVENLPPVRTSMKRPQSDFESSRSKFMPSNNNTQTRPAPAFNPSHPIAMPLSPHFPPRRLPFSSSSSSSSFHHRPKIHAYDSPSPHYHYHQTHPHPES